MFSGDGPPSFSSIRTTNHGFQIRSTGHSQQNSTNQIQRSPQSQPSVTSVNGVNPPSLTDIRHGQHTFLHQNKTYNNNGEGDNPPSVNDIRHGQHTFLHQNKTYNNNGEGDDPPSVNDIRHGQQNFFGQNLAYGFDEPPSVGDMTKGKVSETSAMGGYSYGHGQGQPPSRDDVGGREKEAALTKSQNVDPQELVGMSMVRISERSIRRHMRRTKM